VRDLLITNMDPTMKAGFDAAAASLNDSIVISVATAVATALKDTNAKLDGFLAWKPDLDANNVSNLLQSSDYIFEFNHTAEPHI
jgi:hypothetical protein